MSESEEFKVLSNLIYLSEDDKPEFIPIQVNLTWREPNTNEMNDFSKIYSYVWGRNPTYAAFGPVQEFFQSVILFDIIIKAVALIEQWVVPKVDLQEDYLEDWVTEYDQTLTVDISGSVCISDLDVKNPNLNNTLDVVIADALTKVSVHDVMNYCIV